MRSFAPCVMALLIASSSAHGMGWQGHANDVYSALGMHKSSRQMLSPMLQQFGDTIDNTGSFISDIKAASSPFNAFSWGSFTHRLFFHWGFTGNPKKSKAMRQQVEKTGWDEHVTAAFYEKLETEQGRRNRAMMDLTGQAFGVYARKDRHGMAGLIYDIHMLGDYVEGTDSAIHALVDVPFLLDDIRRRISHDLFPGEPKAKEILNRLSQIGRSPNRPDIKAAEIRQCLIDDLPVLIKKGRGGHLTRLFGKRGLRLR